MQTKLLTAISRSACTKEVAAIVNVTTITRTRRLPTALEHAMRRRDGDASQEMAKEGR